MEDTTQAVQTTGDGVAQAVADSAAQTMPSIEGVEQALLEGDLSELTADQRITYYEKVCQSVGLNPLTRPFEYIRLNGQLTLYAKRDAAEQLRRINGVSIQKLETEERQGVYIVRAHAVDEDGRTDVSTGAVTLPSGGDALANAIMKAETKAKRRVTLSLCGMGWLDETEMSTIPNAEAVDVDHETGEIAGVATVSDQRGRYERRLSKLRERMEDPDTDLKAITDKCFEHAEEEWEWGNEKMEDLEDVARDVQQRLGLAPEEVYIPGTGQTHAFKQNSEAPTEEDETSFKDDLEALEEDLAQAMEADTRKARLEQVSAAMAAFSEAHREPSDDQREAILEVYEPVRAELTSADEEAQPQQSQAADDILEGNTALDEEDEGGEDTSEENG